MSDLLTHYGFGPTDVENLQRLADALLPESDPFAEEFYAYLSQDPYTASFFKGESAIARRKETFKGWLRDLLTGSYDALYLRRLERVGKTHVRIGLQGHYVNASMHFVREALRGTLSAKVPDRSERDRLLLTLDKVLDIHLDVLTSSYREEELKNVFLSKRVESFLVHWTERLMHGLNLVLTVGLLAMAVGVVSLFATDVFNAFTTSLEHGVIKALGSLLILWMMIELLHAEISHLKGGRFHVRIFLELALVAFIRKLFIAALEKTTPVNFGLLLGALLVLGVLFVLVGRAESD